MEISIFRFEPGDWGKYKDSIISIEKIHDPMNIKDSEYLRQLYTSADTLVYLAEADGRIVGLTHGRPFAYSSDYSRYNLCLTDVLDNKIFYNGYIAVMSDFRRRGIGKSLELALVSEAREKGYRFLIGDIADSIGASLARNLCADVYPPDIMDRFPYKIDLEKSAPIIESQANVS